MKYPRCPICGNEYVLGETGVLKGCDQCLHIVRDKSGYPIEGQGIKSTNRKIKNNRPKRLRGKDRYIYNENYEYKYPELAKMILEGISSNGETEINSDTIYDMIDPKNFGWSFKWILNFIHYFCETNNIEVEYCKEHRTFRMK